MKDAAVWQSACAAERRGSSGCVYMFNGGAASQHDERILFSQHGIGMRIDQHAPVSAADRQNRHACPFPQARFIDTHTAM